MIPESVIEELNDLGQKYANRRIFEPGLTHYEASRLYFARRAEVNRGVVILFPKYMECGRIFKNICVTAGLRPYYQRELKKQISISQDIIAKHQNLINQYNRLKDLDHND